MQARMLVAAARQNLLDGKDVSKEGLLASALQRVAEKEKHDEHALLLDADGDGQISLEEARKAADMDKDGDGNLTLTEVKHARKKHETHKAHASTAQKVHEEHIAEIKKLEEQKQSAREAAKEKAMLKRRKKRHKHSTSHTAPASTATADVMHVQELDASVADTQDPAVVHTRRKKRRSHLDASTSGPEQATTLEELHRIQKEIEQAIEMSDRELILARLKDLDTIPCPTREMLAASGIGKFINKRVRKLRKLEGVREAATALVQSWMENTSNVTSRTETVDAIGQSVDIDAMQKGTSSGVTLAAAKLSKNVRRKRKKRHRRKKHQSGAHSRASKVKAAVSVNAMLKIAWLAARAKQRNHQKMLQDKAAEGGIDKSGEPVWQKYEDDDHVPYFFNAATGSTEWHPPEGDLICCGTAGKWRGYLTEPDDGSPPEMYFNCEEGPQKGETVWHLPFRDNWQKHDQ
jgi:hypothetical protein